MERPARVVFAPGARCCGVMPGTGKLARAPGARVVAHGPMPTGNVAGDIAGRGRA